MTRQINMIHLSGNVGSKLPELNRTPNGEPVSDISIANHYSVRDSSQTSGWRDVADWYKVSFWGGLAERIVREVETKRLTKGTEIYIEGRVKVRKYTDENGQNQMTVEINATDYTILQQPATATNSSNGYGNAKTGNKGKANFTNNSNKSAGQENDNYGGEGTYAEDEEEEGGNMPF